MEGFWKFFCLQLFFFFGITEFWVGGCICGVWACMRTWGGNKEGGGCEWMNRMTCVYGMEWDEQEGVRWKRRMSMHRGGDVVCIIYM